jgi:hypothetical protein
MFYANIASGQTSADLYATRRASLTAQFTAGTTVSGLNSTIDDIDPDITPDGAALYFDSARGTTALHLYAAVRRADGSFDAPQPLTALNTTVVDGHPHLTDDGLTLYWSSARTDGGAQGGTDIWLAKRSSTAGTFTTPARVPELSSANNESLSWISSDGCVAYLQSDRPGGKGSQDIYQAVRPR